VLADMGHELVVHAVITGGQALLDTVSVFATHQPVCSRGAFHRSV
jgi:hypothetical protein